VHGVLQTGAATLQLLPFVTKLLESLALRAEPRFRALWLLGGERRGGEQRDDQRQG
jgi:hypothetical protein